MQVEIQHGLRLELGAEVLLDLVDFLIGRNCCLVGNWLDAVLGLLHDILVLQAFNIALLALHVCIK